jgi:phosphomannomutase/phosphoglucomutase
MPRLFGTNGVRGVTNEDMDAELALKLGMAIGTYFGGPVVIGTDTRTSNTMLKNAVTAGLLATGCPVMDGGMVPSPALQLYVKQNNVSAGIMITASHNPPQFNGIKVADSDGTELDKEKELLIEDIFFNQTWKLVSWDTVGQVTSVAPSNAYVASVLNNVNTTAISKKAYTIVLDCGNGAGSHIYPHLIRRLGCKVVTLNAQPDGTFPGREAEPTPDNIALLLDMVPKCGADLGIAYDGDADRAIFVDETGAYISGDKTLALTAAHQVACAHGGTVVTPISTSSCVEEMVTQTGGTVTYTKVGSPIVARRMMDLGAIFGGEENGGLIFPEHQYCRDGGMASAAVLDLMAQREMSLAALVAEVPSYWVAKTKVACVHEQKHKIMHALLEKAQAEAKRIDDTDGVKIIECDGWVLIRPSGTEPIIRIYGESKSQEQAERLVDSYRHWVEDFVAEKR